MYCSTIEGPLFEEEQRVEKILFFELWMVLTGWYSAFQIFHPDNNDKQLSGSIPSASSAFPSCVHKAPGNTVVVCLSYL